MSGRILLNIPVDSIRISSRDAESSYPTFLKARLALTAVTTGSGAR